jgi:hypothetical protein
LLDLLITIYTDLNSPPSKSFFVFPNDFGSANSHLYHNNGDGTFREISSTAGLGDNPGRTRKALAADFSHKGRLDLLLLRDNKPPAFFQNKGQGLFEDQTWATGKENWKYAYVDGQLADFNHDGKIDVAVWSTIGNEVLMNQGDGKFEPEKTFPIVFAANRPFGFHGLVADINGDGNEDLLTVDNNGRWHFIANHAGRLAEVPIRLPGTETESHNRQAATSLPELSCLVPFRSRKSDPIMLVGVRIDGTIVALRRRSETKARASSSK